ncbi:transcription factor myb3r-2 [Anaeramoeba flamelloides]|uniref:Transcription factor myb3r-2 n=1 Tax=Anaeramoeba flamelloides TaxID=1746091 RepID=A0AAV7YQ35_9EUKA|nr:transcription factor myb3r-2 [Anaeramoeba flamelloides]
MQHHKQNEFETSQLYEQLLLGIDHKMSSWTQEEDEKLMRMINSHQDDWEKCSKSFHQRDSFQCFRRYILLRKKNTKGSWTKIEDHFLRKYVDLLGNDKWNQIGTLVPGRISKQCRERWNNQLNPKIKTCRFSQEERMLLISLQKQFGNKWTKISTYFQGRTGNQLKNFWHSNISSENRLKRSLKQNEKMIQEKKKMQKRQESLPTKSKRRRKNNRKKIIVVRRRNNQKRKTADLGEFQNTNQTVNFSFSKIQPELTIGIKPKIGNEDQRPGNKETCHPILNFSPLKLIETINNFNVIIPEQKTIQRKRSYDQTSFKPENTATYQKNTNENGNLNEKENENKNKNKNKNEKDFFSQTLLKSSETTTIPTSPKEKKYEFFQINEIASEDDSCQDNNFTFLKKEPFSTNFNTNPNFNSFESFDSQDFSDIRNTQYNFYDSDFIDLSFNSQTETYSGNSFLDNFQL